MLRGFFLWSFYSPSYFLSSEAFIIARSRRCGKRIVTGGHPRSKIGALLLSALVGEGRSFLGFVVVLVEASGGGDGVLAAHHATSLHNHFIGLLAGLVALVLLTHSLVLLLGRGVGPSLFLFLVRVGISGQVPRAVHHNREVLVIIETGRHVGVVLNPLFLGNPTICLVSILYIVMHFKCF